MSGSIVEAPSSEDAVEGQIKAILDRWAREGLARCSLIKSENGFEIVYSEDGESLQASDKLTSLIAWVTAVHNHPLLRGKKQERQPAGLNGPSTTKSRGRPLDPVVARRRDRLVEMAEQSQPATVRQLYYLAETEGLVPKAENGYRQVQHDVLLLRREGRIPYAWISDNTRWMRKSRSYRGIDHFLNLTINTYRRDLWAAGDVHIEVWVEKDALAGVIMEETDPYDVPLLVARGCSSETYLYETARTIAELEKTAYIYHFGDHDPTGVVAATHIERRLRQFAPDTEIHFQRVAVTPEQILAWKLPTRPTKRDGNRHAKGFEGDSCELDAIPPLKLRQMVRNCIEQHLDLRKLDVLKEAESSERDALRMFAQSWRASA